MARKLKVYRTAIGFHDAYVAAPSQKAALQAWGSDANLFSLGMAELVTDETLTKAPLETPGEVVKVTRGSAEDHYAALPTEPAARRGNKKRKGRRAHQNDTVVGDSDRDDVGGDGSRRKRDRVGKGRNDSEDSEAEEVESRGRQGAGKIKRKRSAPSGPKEWTVTSPPSASSRAAGRLVSSKPRPSREKLDAAERALEAAIVEHRAAVEAVRVRERALERERRALEDRNAKAEARLEAAVAKAEKSYGTALDMWRRT